MTDPYFEWLRDMVCDEDGTDISYNRLLRDMYEYPFYPLMMDDENRVYDALSLRKEWGGIGSRGSGEASMLEIAISLARRVAYLADANGDDDNVPRWFWELIENADLDIYTDLNYDAMGGFENVKETLRTIVDRDYSTTGEGSFFPIPNGDKCYNIEPFRVQINDYIKFKYMEE